MKRMKHKIISEQEVKTKQNKQNIIFFFTRQTEAKESYV